MAVVELTVADLGEDRLLERLFPVLPAGSWTILGPGDDAAVVAAADGRVVVTTDVLVADQHFRMAWASGADVGWRAAAANLADIAAMGARPTALVVALVVPPTTAVAWLTDLADGLAQACAPLGVGVVGGDLSAGPQIVVSVTALGDLQGREPITRDGGRPGDVVAHAGVCGHSAAGLALLSAGAGHGPADREQLIAVYLRPRPPITAGVAAAEHGATAMIDLSDGLLRDAGRLARASGVVVGLEDTGRAFGGDHALLAPAAEALGADAGSWILSGGEDHGLLATFPAGATLPEPFRAIGVLQAPGAHPAGTVLVDGVEPTGSPGWDHFAR